MRRMLVVLGLTLLMVTGMFAQSDAKKPMTKKSGGDATSIIMDLEHKWTEAGKKSDATMMDSILADGFITMDTDGAYKTKKEYMDGFGKSKWEVNEVSDLKVAVHGNYALVTGIWNGKGIVNGKPFESKERWLDTFAKQSDGSWKAISSAATKIK